MSPLGRFRALPLAYLIPFHIFNILNEYIECQVFYRSN